MPAVDSPATRAARTRGRLAHRLGPNDRNGFAFNDQGLPCAPVDRLRRMAAVHLSTFGLSEPRTAGKRIHSCPPIRASPGHPFSSRTRLPAILGWRQRGGSNAVNSRTPGAGCQCGSPPTALHLRSRAKSAALSKGCCARPHAAREFQRNERKRDDPRSGLSANQHFSCCTRTGRMVAAWSPA